MAYYKKGWGRLRRSDDYLTWSCFFKSRRWSTEGSSYTCRFPASKMQLLPVLKYDISSMTISWEKPKPGDVYTEVRIEW